MKISTGLYGKIILVAVLSGCASPYQASYRPTETVLETSDGMQIKPPWINEAVPLKSEQGQITALGEAQIPADYRLEAGFDIARANAQRRFSRELEERLDIMSNNADVADQAGYIGNKAVNAIAANLKAGPKYWEKLSVQSADRNYEIYRMYTTMSVPEEAYKKAAFTAIEETQKKNLNGMSPSFPQILNTQWPKLVGPASDIRPVAEFQVPSAPVAMPAIRNPASLPAAIIIEGKYTLQISAFLDEQRAQNLVSSLKSKGLDDAYYIPAKINGQVFYRVSVGQFKNRAAALRYAKKSNLTAFSKMAFIRNNSTR